MAPTNPISRNQFLITVRGLDYYWETFSGINDQAQTNEYSDGLSNRTYTLVGPRKVQNVTVTKAFDPQRDKEIVDWHRNYCQGQGEEQTMSVTPVRFCPNPEPIGPSVILYGVRPVSLQFGEADKKSNDVAMLSLELAVDDYEYA